LLIWAGFGLGVLDWITDWAYLSNSQFGTPQLKGSCLLFIILQPILYVFLYFVYIISHEEIETAKERSLKMALMLPYAALMQFKLLGSFEDLNRYFFNKFKRKDQFLLFNLENSYRL
jgi:hypothetical protein